METKWEDTCRPAPKVMHNQQIGHNVKSVWSQFDLYWEFAAIAALMETVEPVDWRPTSLPESEIRAVFAKF